MVLSTRTSIQSNLTTIDTRHRHNNGQCQKQTRPLLDSKENKMISQCSQCLMFTTTLPLLLCLLLQLLLCPIQAEHVENTTTLLINPTLKSSNNLREGWRQETSGVLCQTLQVGANETLRAGETYVLVASRRSTAINGTIEVHDGDSCVVNGKALQNLGGSGCTIGSPCSMCQGDCDKDLDCAVNLKCVHRDGLEPVYGCDSGGSGDVSGSDYCAPSPRFTSTLAVHVNGRFQAPYAGTASSVSIALRSTSNDVWGRVDLFKVLCTPDLSFTKELPRLYCESTHLLHFLFKPHGVNFILTL